MRVYIVKFTLLFIYFFCGNSLSAQTGMNCDTSTLICNVSDLNGIGISEVASLPPTGITGEQPTSLCAGNGVPDNPVWYAFIAGSTEITISLSPDNCTEVDNGSGGMSQGMQAAIFSGCDFLTVMDCDSDGVMFPNTIELTSNAYVIGQVYYLLLDGWNGSICDYGIAVTEGLEDFEPMEIDSIVYVDTICNPQPMCVGVNVPFDFSNWPLDTSLNVEYIWTISPTTSDYPDGIHPNHDSVPIIFHFSEAGIYTITGIANGACDTTNMLTTEIEIVESTDINEVFATIEICQEDFPTYITDQTMTQDPNGDGVFGWLGEAILVPGMTTYSVETDCGCTYTQTINIIQIDLAPRVEIDTVFCRSNPGPYIFEGMDITEDLDSMMTITAVSGCDSLITFKAVFIDIKGDLVIGECTDSVLIYVENEVFKPIDYDMLEYIWKDGFGTVVTDLNMDNTSLKVVDGGEYSLTINMVVGDVVCEQIIDTISFDPTMVSLDTPTPDNWDIEMCENIDTLSFSIISDPDLNVIWSWPADVTLIDGQGTNVINLDWSNNNTGGDLCVKVQSMCAESKDTCITLTLMDVPVPSFDLIDTICIDSIYMLNYTGELGHNFDYNWEFYSAIETNIGSDDSGPYELYWNAAGLQKISLQLNNTDCISDNMVDSIFVLDKLSGPDISCESINGNLIFSWIEAAEIGDYEVILIDGSAGVLMNNNSYIVSGLSDGDFVEIAVYGETLGQCTTTYESTIKCFFEACPTIEIVLNTTEIGYCKSDMSDVQLEVNIIGDATGIGNWEGTNVSVTGILQPALCDIGINVIYYNYKLGSCNYKDSIEVEIYETPQMLMDTINGVCYDDYSSIIFNGNGNGPFLYSFNGAPYTDQIEYTDIDGTNTMVINDVNNCQYTVSGNYNLPNQADLILIGNSTINAGEKANLELLIDLPMDRIDSIIWYQDGNPVCFDCLELSVTQEASMSSYCAELFYDGSCIEEVCIEVKLLERYGVYIPNIFIPGSDDAFNTIDLDIGHRNGLLKEFMIMDRWGNQMVHIQNHSFSGSTIIWDGRFQGELVSPAVFVYYYELELEGEKTKQKIGDITVIR